MRLGTGVPVPHRSLFKAVFSRQLNRNSVVTSTRFKSLMGGGARGWIVSKWSDPESGKRHESFCPALWRNPVHFLPKEIRFHSENALPGLRERDSMGPSSQQGLTHARRTENDCAR